MNRTGIVVALAVIATATVLTAGPINPPAGPIAATAKPLSEVEPRIAINAANTPGDATSLFIITQPGSYYLTGNITGVVGKHGIVIAASGVTLDLNGFDILGIPNSLGGVSVVLGGLRNIAVLNGSVRNWSGIGVDVWLADNSRLTGLLASGNRTYGIRTGYYSTVSNCSAVSTANVSIGLSVGNGSTVSNCSAYNNSSGFSAGPGCTITDCTAYQNTTGISTGDGCTVSNCAAYRNGDVGIQSAAGCTISKCTAYNNVAWGISVTIGSTVADCTSRSNILDGIVCNSQCILRENTCSGNGTSPGDGAGILANGSDNRIEGNNCTGGNRGIDVDAPGNIIIRNTCSGNLVNWSIDANNVVGPIVDRSAPGSAAINGNAAPDSTGTTHPNANFSY